MAIQRPVLGAVYATGLTVIVMLLSLPGARWSQKNGGVHDDRIRTDPAYQYPAVSFWADLAAALKDIRLLRTAQTGGQRPYWYRR